MFVLTLHLKTIQMRRKSKNLMGEEVDWMEAGKPKMNYTGNG